MTLLNISDNSIDKSLFAKIVPRKYSAYVTHSGNVRKISTDEFIEGIEYDPNELITPVRKYTLAELSANGHWFWDRDAEYVYFYYSGALTNIVLKIGLFVTTTVDVLAPSSIGSLTVLDLTVYEGRMQETSFMQSCEDILSGKLGITTSTISIINNDSRYNKYAEDNTSFKNAEIKVWIVINDFANRSLIFNGLCQNVNFADSNITLDVIELTKALQQDATFLDTKSWSTINRTTWPDCKEQEIGESIPMFLCGGSKKTASKTRSVFYYIDSITYEQIKVSNYDFWDVNSETDLKLKYVGIQAADIAYPGGKKYIAARCKTGEFPQNFHWNTDKSTTPLLIDAIANADISITKSVNMGSYGYRYAEYSIEAKSTNINLIKMLYAGMMVYLRNTTANSYHNMIVTFVDTSLNKFGVRFFGGASNTNLKITSNNYQLHYRGPTVYAIIDGVPVFLPWDNYYFKFEATDGGNNIIYGVVTPELGSESYEYLSGDTVKSFRLFGDDLGWSAADVPDLEYYCRFLNFKIVSDMSTYTVGKVLNTTARLVKEIVTDSPSDVLVIGNSYYDFDQKIGTTEYIDIISGGSDSYLNIVEQILASTMAFMCIDVDGQLIVRLFENIPYESILLNLTEDDIKDRSITSDIDFTEIASSIYSKPEYSLDQSIISTSDRVKRITGEIKFDYRHLLKSNSIYSAKIKSRLESYKLFPIKRYSFTIINKGYELTLGDRISISFDNSGKWLGTNSTKSLFVVKINKSLSGVQITAIENNFP